MTKVTYAQLNIGRNVGTVPMDDTQWGRFIEHAKAALAYGAGEDRRWFPAERDARIAQAQVHYGTGEWAGVAEDSAHVSLFAEDGIDVAKLQAMASDLASMFEQDAIAVILGSTLITA